MTSTVAFVALFICQRDSDVQEYTIFLAPFDGYAQPNPSAGTITFLNIECSAKPLITDSIVQYTSADQHFAVVDSRPFVESDYKVPNETIDAIHQVYSLAISSWVR